MEETIKVEEVSLSGDVDFTNHINCVKLNKNAILPTRGSKEAAGYDLYTPNNSHDIIIEPHKTELVQLDLSMAIPRSGLSMRQGLRPANCVGVIDSDYRGNVAVALHNDTDLVQIVKGGDRIAQLIVIPYVSITFDEVESLDDTERGEGGFGSTDN